MGIKGPLPKAHRQRPRDERRQRQTVLDSHGRKAPALPGALKLPPQVRAWWRVLWASPLAAQYHDVDEPGLVRMALLWGKAIELECSAAELGELRQLEDRAGLNPTARRRLGWQLEEPRPVPAPTPIAGLSARVVEMKGRLEKHGSK